jgi:hypothetical protein
MFQSLCMGANPLLRFWFYNLNSRVTAAQLVTRLFLSLINAIFPSFLNLRDCGQMPAEWILNKGFEVVMAWFQPLTLYLLEGTEANHIQDSFQAEIFEPGSSRTPLKGGWPYIIFHIGSLTSEETNAVLYISPSFFRDVCHIGTNFDIVIYSY